ncbi:MAG: sugar phosphate isomerase/epimerase [Clostridia bacterium]|nr:sugar phosphate isomerase/epimerase [Clostridia bacterium]
MKLSFSTLGCPDWSLRYAVEQAKTLGFQAVEIRGIGDSLRSDTIEELLPENRAASLQFAKENGIGFCCLGASASFHEADKRRENREEALATVKLAAACGIPYVRVFGNDLVTDDEDTEIGEIAGQIRTLCEEARDDSVTVLLEVHGDFNTSDRVLKTADCVNCDNFGIIWDVQHSREDPVRFWERTKHLIRHVHIKDSIRTKLCPVGEGELPVASIVRMLENDGYDGYYSLEWEKRWHPELRDAAEEFPSFVKFMNEIRNDQS